MDYCVWLLSLCIIFLRLFHEISYSSFLFIVKYCFSVWLSYLLTIHEYLACHHILATLDNVPIKPLNKNFCEHTFSFLLSVYIESELLDCVEVILFRKLNVSQCGFIILHCSSNGWEFQFLITSLSSLASVSFIGVDALGVKYNRRYNLCFLID